MSGEKFKQILKKTAIVAGLVAIGFAAGAKFSDNRHPKSESILVPSAQQETKKEESREKVARLIHDMGKIRTPHDKLYSVENPALKELLDFAGSDPKNPALVEAIPRLIEMLGKSDDEYYTAKNTAIRVIGIVGVDEKQFSSLLKMLGKERSDDEKIGAAWAIYFVCKNTSLEKPVCRSSGYDEKTISELISRLEDSDMNVQREMVDVLGEFREKKAAPALIRFLERTVPKKFDTSVWLMDSTNVKLDEGSRTMLKWRCQARVHAAIALGRMNDISAVPILLKAAKNDYVPVRVAALRAILNISDLHKGDPSLAKIIPDLEKIASDDPGNWEYGVRSAAVDAVKGISR